MSAIAHRIARLERRYGAVVEDNPYRIPPWLEPWFAPLAIEDLEILEAGGFIREAGGDLATLPPETRARYEELCASYARYCEEHAP